MTERILSNLSEKNLLIWRIALLGFSFLPFHNGNLSSNQKSVLIFYSSMYLSFIGLGYKFSLWSK